MSVKKVFKIIGIVLGCTVGFVAAVLGVFAAMGKFTTPVVKPNKLYFENPEQVIVAQYKDDKGKDIIYSFKLIGENDSIDHPVNVKDCKIWFKDTASEALIELCDKDGNPLVPDKQKRYLVNCNEEIYYKLKPIDESVTYDPSLGLDFGLVVLQARTADDSEPAKKDLEIWIDRNVTSIFLDYGTIPTATSAKEQTQVVYIPKDTTINFDYVINPAVSLRPISKESEKLVELFYRDESSIDWVLVNLENIKNANYNLKNIFDAQETERTGKLVFYSQDATVGVAHEFKLAIFPSYQAKVDYEKNQNENTELKNSKRLEKMVVTNLKIEVVNINVDTVEMSSNPINLELFAEREIYLNNSQQENDLKISMKNNTIAIDARLDEVSFEAMTPMRFNGYPKFVANQNITLKEIDFRDYNVTDFKGSELELTHIETGSVLTFETNMSITVDGYKIINRLTLASSGVSYYCANGIAFIKDKNNIKLLNSGSYLDFYIYDASLDAYVQATEGDIEYDYEVEGTGKDKKWKLTVISTSADILNGTKNLCLGLMVANNDGGFDVNNMFKSIPVNIVSEDLEIRHKVFNATLNNVLTESGNELDKLQFNYFFDVVKGTYNACVLVISEKEIFTGVAPDLKDVSIVDYINAYYVDDKGTETTTDDEKYYVVGYFKDGHFVNEVRVKNNPNAISSTVNKLKLLQLTNVHQETAEAAIDRLLDGNLIDYIDLTSYSQDLINEVTTINQKLLLDNVENWFNIKVDNKDVAPTELYSKTSSKLEISSVYTGLIDRLINYYSINATNYEDYIKVNYNSNVFLKDFTYADGVITVGFDVDAVIADDPNVSIYIDGIFATKNPDGTYTPTGTVNLYSFKIKSSAPEKVYYYYGDSDSTKFLELANSKELVTNDKVLTAKITWDDANSKYVIKWYVNDVEIHSDLVDAEQLILNSKFEKDVLLGFQDPDYKISHDVQYDIINENNNPITINADQDRIIVSNIGEAYLRVMAYGQSKWLKIEVIAEGFELSQKSNLATGSSFKLTDVLLYEANGKTIFNLVDKIMAIEDIYLGFSKVLECEIDGENRTYYYESDVSGVPTRVDVLNISKTATDWEFTRVKDVYAQLNVTFVVVTKTGKLELRVQFERDVVYDLNALALGDESRLYQNTTILVYEEAEGSNPFEYQALLKIRDKTTNAISVNVTLPDGSTNTSKEITLNQLGVYKFEILSNGTVIGTERLTVVPNVAIEVQSTTENWSSGSISESVDNYIKLNKYPTENLALGVSKIVYGKTSIDGTIALYSTIEKQLDTDNSLLKCVKLEMKNTLNPENRVVLKDVDATNVTTPWISKIGATEEFEVFVMASGYEMGKFDVVVENKFVVELKSSDLTDGDVLNIKAMTNINDWLKVNGFTISSVKWTSNDGDQEFATADIPALSKVYNNVMLTLTLQGNTAETTDKTLIYQGNTIADLSINIIPFKYNFLTNIEAYSENEFEIWNGVYGSHDDLDDYYLSIEVLAVEDENGNNISASPLGSVYGGTGVQLSAITFGKIYKDSTSIFITYRVKYKGLIDSYTYDEEITLQNWQDLLKEYPEQGEDLQSSYVRFAGNNSFEDFDLENVDFESVLINASKGTTIDLLSVENNFKRLTAKDRFDENKEVDLTIADIQIIGYQKGNSISNYISKVVIDVQHGTITFPAYASVNGMLMFRIISTSGNFEDYCVKVVSLGSDASVDASRESFKNVEITADTSIQDIAESQLGVFGVDVEKIKMYLANSIQLGDKDVNKFNSSSLGNVEQNKCVNDVAVLKDNVKDFTTLTLRLIYSKGNSVYPVGNLILYLRPQGAPASIEGYSQAIDGVSNGEFNYEIANNFDMNEVIEFPTDFTTESMSNDVFEINGGIKIKKRVENDYVFTVFYKKGDLTLKVTYTYKATNIASSSSKIVGNLNDEKTAFIDYVEIDSRYLGDYCGSFAIKENENSYAWNRLYDASAKEYIITGSGSVELITGVRVEIIGNKLYFIFTQGLKQELKTLTFVFGDANAKEVPHTFTVKPGVVIEANASDNSGVSDALKLATERTLTFEQVKGSEFIINRESKEITVLGTDQKHVKYSFGGYVIYIKGEGGSVEFVFDTTLKDGGYSDSSYVTSELTDGSIKINDNSSIGFVHLAKSYDMVATFKVRDSKSNYFVEINSTNPISTALYLRLSQTYSKITAKYLTVGASHENVVHGTKLGETSGLIGYLFNNISSPITGLNNKNRLEITKLDENGKEDGKLEESFVNMGFNINTNPNYITFEAKANGVIKTSGSKQYIEFNSNISSNQYCNVYMSNVAGIKGAEYIFQVMSGDEKEGIDFSKVGYADRTSKYMSFVVNDRDRSSQYETSELLLGTLSDSEVKRIFVVGASNVKTLIKGGSESEITYPQKDANDNEFKIILRGHDVYVKYIRKENNDVISSTGIAINVNLHGVTDYILQNFSVVFINSEIKSIEGTDSVYGGVEFDLIDSEKLILPAGVSKGDITLTLDLEKSKYGNNKLSENENFVSFNSSTNDLTTKTVGETTNLQLVFNAIVGSYRINDIVYNLTLNRSLQFFVNGDQPVLNEQGNWTPNSNPNLLTNFVLTNGGNSSNTFPLQYTIQTNLDKTDINQHKNNYYSVLAYSLQNCVGDDGSATISLNPDRANPGSDVVTVSAGGVVTFKKDYTGTINILLTSSLRNGTQYSVNWEIKVYGILNFTPKVAKADEPIDNNGAPFNSGETVYLISANDSAKGWGLHAQHMMDYFGTQINYVTGSGADVGFDVDYSSKIVLYNPYDGKTNEQRFGATGSITEEKVGDRNLPITLPIVPASIDAVQYLVIYKVDIKYLQSSDSATTYNPTLTYYVAYLVTNQINISLAKAGTSPDFVFGNIINVKNRLEEDTKLDLFHYSEIYTDGANDYNIYVGYNSGVKYYYKKGTDEAVECSLTFSDNKLTITPTTGESITNLTRKSVNNFHFESNKLSVFNLSFNNIADFKTFLETVGYVNIGDYNFRLTHIRNGRWGIDLKLKYAKTDTSFNTVKASENLFSNVCEDKSLNIVATNGQTLYSVVPYSQNNDEGLRMYITNSLKPQGAKLVKDLFISSTVSNYTTYQNYEIVGVFKDVASIKTDWVLNAASCEKSGLDQVLGFEAKVRKDQAGTQYITYTMYSVKFTGSGGITGVCDITQYFYAIKSTEDAAIYKSIYNDNDIIAYNANHSSTVALASKFKKFENNTDGALVEIDADITKVEVKTSGVHTESNYFDSTTEMLTLTKAELQAYKNAHPNENEVEVEYLVTFAGKTFYWKMYYELPPTASES